MRTGHLKLETGAGGAARVPRPTCYPNGSKGATHCAWSAFPWPPSDTEVRRWPPPLGGRAASLSSSSVGGWKLEVIASWALRQRGQCMTLETRRWLDHKLDSKLEIYHLNRVAKFPYHPAVVPGRGGMFMLDRYVCSFNSIRVCLGWARSSGCAHFAPCQSNELSPHLHIDECLCWRPSPSLSTLNSKTRRFFRTHYISSDKFIR